MQLNPFGQFLVHWWYLIFCISAILLSVLAFLLDNQIIWKESRLKKPVIFGIVITLTGTLLGIFGLFLTVIAGWHKLIQAMS